MDSRDDLPARVDARRSPRLLRIITRLNVGGPATHVTLADRGLQARGWQTLLAHGVVETGEAEIDIASMGVATIRIPTLHRSIDPIADARSVVELGALIRRFRPDVIHSHLSKAGLVGRSAALATSSAVRVHTFHGNVFGGYFGPRVSKGVLMLERALGSRTHRIIALSERQRSELADLRVGDPARIRVVPLGVDLDRFAGGDRRLARARLGVPADALVVLAVGRMVPIKRLDRLVEAFAVAAATIPHLRLWLVGDGEERTQLEGRVRMLGLGERVTFAGWSTDTPSWYAAADIVVLTSDREGTPLALIEAAASGRPVVAGDVGGVADVVIDRETGFVVEQDDVPAFAERIIRLALDPALRERMGAAAPALAASFAADRLVDDLVAVYREALLERRIVHRRAQA